MSAKLTILGAGSALPTRYNFPSAQILELRDKQYMIDCGEGAQIRMRQMGLKNTRLNHIFISHLHGDHCFGLMGLISSFALLNRTAELQVHGPLGITKLFEQQMNFFCDGIPFKVSFQEFDTLQHKLIYADRSVEVYSIPLKHRVPCSGFLFKEKPKDRHLIRDIIDFYQIPISQRNLIKKGADFISEEGKTIPNHLLTTDPDKTISYAYCSDTAYCEEIVPIISKVDLLYHEATFANAEVLRAQKTMHSTAEQAANIARLAEVKQLVIGHLSARYKNQDAVLKEAQAVFKDTTLARDGQVIEF